MVSYYRRLNMLHGIIDLNENARLGFKKGGNRADIVAPSSITASYSIKLPQALPGSTQAMVMTATGEIQFISPGGGGSVTSIALALPDIFNVSGSPITTSGALTATLKNQSANTFFAAPNGASGAPTFRTIVWGDVSSLVGISGNSFAAGNDSRFHLQNTDSGTAQSSFQIDSGNSGFRIKNSSGVAEFRDSSDGDYADIRVKNIFITGNQTRIEPEILTINDNIIELNSNITSGTPTENLGIVGRRGDSTSASFIFDESSDRWAAGLEGSEKPIVRVHEDTFTSASLTGGLLVVTHNLGRKIVDVTIANNSDEEIKPDLIKWDTVNQVTIDLSTYASTMTGTWTFNCRG
jgi:hypothetical protein